MKWSWRCFLGHDYRGRGKYSGRICNRCHRLGGHAFGYGPW